VLSTCLSIAAKGDVPNIVNQRLAKISQMMGLQIPGTFVGVIVFYFLTEGTLVFQKPSTLILPPSQIRMHISFGQSQT
jgi:hypothetical protein